MKALHGAGWLAHLQRNSTAARTLLEESLAIAEERADDWWRAWVVHALGRVAYFEGDVLRAAELAQRSLTIAERLGDAWLIAWTAHALVHQPLEIFRANIFHPATISLAFTENMIGLAIPVANRSSPRVEGVLRAVCRLCRLPESIDAPASISL